MSYCEELTSEEIRKGFYVGLKIVWEDNFGSGETITSCSFDLRQEEAKREFESGHDIYTIISEEPIFIGDLDIVKLTDEEREDYAFLMDRLGLKNVKPGSALWNLLTILKDRYWSTSVYKNEDGKTCVDYEVNYDRLTMCFDTDGNIIGLN